MYVMTSKTLPPSVQSRTPAGCVHAGSAFGLPSPSNHDPTVSSGGGGGDASLEDIQRFTEHLQPVLHDGMRRLKQIQGQIDGTGGKRGSLPERIRQVEHRRSIMLLCDRPPDQKRHAVELHDKTRRKLSHLLARLRHDRMVACRQLREQVARVCREHDELKRRSRRGVCVDS